MGVECENQTRGLLLVEPARLYIGYRSLKAEIMSASVIPFLVMRVVYLISARRLVRLSPTIENPGWLHEISGNTRILATKKI